MRKKYGYSIAQVEVGKKFNDWTAIEYVGMAKWLFECACGKQKVCDAYSVVSGKSKRCQGCGNRAKAEKRKISGDHVAARQSYAKYRSTAKNRGIYFDLTFDEYYEMAKKDCEYCGSPPEGGYWEKSSYRQEWQDPFISNGIDRFDNSKGYSYNNCVSCCIDCNRAKNAMSVDKWKDKIKCWSDWLEKTHSL